MTRSIPSHPSLPDTNSTPFPELWPLVLPSVVPLRLRPAGSLGESLAAIERRLRFAQATDALSDLCQRICVRSHLLRYKKNQVSGQQQSTRANALLRTAENKIKTAAERYRRARKAHLALLDGASNEDTAHLRELKDGDIRALDDSEINPNAHQAHQQGEGYRQLSWIWMQTGGVTEGSAKLDAGTIISLRPFGTLLTNM